MAVFRIRNALSTFNIIDFHSSPSDTTNCNNHLTPRAIIMADRVKEVAIGEAERIKALTSDAARSGAYLYPLRVSVPPPLDFC